MKYVENRCYFLLLEPKSINRNWHYEVQNTAELSDLKITEHDDKKNIFSIQYDDDYDNEIIIDFSSKINVSYPKANLKRCTFTISDTGFGNLVSEFDYTGQIQQLDLEETVDHVIECIDKLNSEISAAVSTLAKFGITKFVNSELLGKKDFETFISNNCLLNGHFFIADIGNSFKTLEIDSKENLLGLKCNVLPGAYIYLWEVKDKDSIEKVFGIDFYALSESLLIKSSVTIYSDLMAKADSQTITSKGFRDVYNYLTRLLSGLAIVEFDFSSEQRKFLQVHRRLANVTYRNLLLNDTKKAAQFIIEGIEAERSQKTGDKIQLILAIFTGITIYSVANDVIAILNSETFFINSIVGQKLSIISLLTLAVCALIFLLKRGK